MDTQRKTIVVASHNRGKLKEMEAMLSPLGFQVEAADSLGIDVEKAIESGTTFKENSLIKAQYVYDHLKEKMPVIADDSGICFAGLNGFPGIHSARWAPDGQTSYDYKNRKILTLLQGKDHTCTFHCVITLIDATGIHQFEGLAQGEAVEPVSTGRGFGYDPIFRSDDLGITFGEATIQQKDQVSHRGRACAKLIAYLKKNQMD
ncbi:MAG TPA: non-canonical purine NTP pyrophosphatase, RdgB/HAM1 family [Firmicutes bacterium]|nr:non-canonical purine NTP pyrophosphatase, RdgB/HAM1 family [Bacillota bacterium]